MERGTQVVGANLAVQAARSAGSFSASPSANPAGPRKRLELRGFCAAFCGFGLAVAGLTAPTALASTSGKLATTGGANVPSPLSGGGLGSAAEEIIETTPGKVEDAPVTAKNSILTYNGPVYEKTAAGEVISYPYTPPPVASASSKSSK